MASIEPDAYTGDPYGYVTNEAGHIVLGLCIASVAAFLGLWWPKGKINETYCCTSYISRNH